MKLISRIWHRVSALFWSAIDAIYAEADAYADPSTQVDRDTRAEPVAEAKEPKGDDAKEPT